MAKNLQVIVGLGMSGLSCARYFAQQGIPFAMMDSRANPPNLAQCKQEFPDVEITVGKLNERLLNAAERVIVSPGLALTDSLLAEQVAQGKPVIGDIELFNEVSNVPIIAITGTNAKSTVTTLVGEMARAAKINAQVGGNIGIPALSLLEDSKLELAVLELSSFQLETTFSLTPHVATVLNVTPDHLDRYTTLRDYQQAKIKIYQDCQVAVCNRDDPLTDCGTAYQKEKLNFTLNTPSDAEFGIIMSGKEAYLAHGTELLLPVAELPILGRHYQANALAALAIGYGYGIPMQAMLNTLTRFKGLNHRCQLVRELHGVAWYNDSKGTNVGATLAAIEGLGQVINGKLVLIAGGVGKNADFSPLLLPIEKYVKQVVLLGEAAPMLAAVMADRVDVMMARDMAEAVMMAASSAEPGDSVLLSPACASFDMFNNFEHRGTVFMQEVANLI